MSKDKFIVDLYFHDGDYLRHAPEHKLLAPNKDAYVVFIWLQDIAWCELSDQCITSYIDFSQVYVVGDNTSGNLVHQRCNTKDHPITCSIGPKALLLATLKLPPMLVTVTKLDLLHDGELEYCKEMEKS
ncbi:hypothetical protein POTOM_024579 [Populus tomentosa]|uniref:Alpha/beta hydrolase fold-3 domain-containing protein n=1 Tax=Populus tomentosa TaxID=118781 RepID=A0A8X8CWE8_POPTO|nr:hypothetical protein POTOM_024579 [Populus tomentosa]